MACAFAKEPTKQENMLEKTIQVKPALRFGEFVALMALMTSLVALSIDAMLPALSEIGQDLGVERENSTQLVVSVLFIGMAVGQMFYGPISDSTGRKSAIYVGFGLFIAGSILALVSTSFTALLAGRVLQGLGAAGPRIVSVALIRDQYAGREMARVMSFVMTVFILVPVIAPSLGQVILLIASWRAIFGLFLVLALITLTWFGLRQPETLLPAQRTPFSLGRIMRAIGEVLRNRIAFGYTLTAGVVFGAFLGYLNSSQQIFQLQYGLGKLFPLYFGILAISLGCASFANGKLVMRFGMRFLAKSALMMVCALSTVFFVMAFMWAGHPPLWLFMFYFIVAFFGVGILFGNLNAMAMEPLGHIAGVGAAVVGSLSTFISLILGAIIGQLYNGTVLPLVGGFAVLSAISLVIITWVGDKEAPA